MKTVNLLEKLTVKEAAVYRLICQGWTNKEIAEELQVSDHTVKFHLARIMRTLGVRNRSSAIAYGQRWQRVEMPSSIGGAAEGVWTERQIREAASHLGDLGFYERKRVNEVVNDLLSALAGEI